MEISTDVCPDYFPFLRREAGKTEPRRMETWRERLEMKARWLLSCFCVGPLVLFHKRQTSSIKPACDVHVCQKQDASSLPIFAPPLDTGFV